MYNRKERREMEKKLGLHKKYQDMSESNKAEVRKKKRETGDQIHLQNLQENENRISQAESTVYAQQIQNWMKDGKTAEEAEAIVKANYELTEKRALKLIARKNK